jgi:hypothetical protein
MDALGVCLGAIREHMPQLGELGVAVLFHEFCDVLATSPAAQRALDREGRDAEVREGVGSAGLLRQIAGTVRKLEFLNPPRLGGQALSKG